MRILLIGANSISKFGIQQNMFEIQTNYFNLTYLTNGPNLHLLEVMTVSQLWEVR